MLADSGFATWERRQAWAANGDNIPIRTGWSRWMWIPAMNLPPSGTV